MALRPYSEFRKQFTKKNLHLIYSEISEKSGATGLDGINHHSFTSNLDRELNTIIRKTFNGTYNFTQYKEKLVLKGATKYPRQISIPSIRDRVCLKAISQCLFKVYSKDIGLEIPQIKIEKLNRELKTSNYTCFIKVDIKNFYPSIDHTILESKIKRKFRKDISRNLFLKALKTSTSARPDKNLSANSIGIPQGLSISNILAEMYISCIDNLMSKEKCFYLRYVDDILILCNRKDIKPIYEKLYHELGNISLSCHELGVDKEKTHTGNIDDKFTYLGYLVSGSKITVKPNSVKNLEASIAKIFTTYKYKNEIIRSRRLSLDIESLELEKNRKILEWRLNLRITGCIFDDTKRGWIFYFSQINDLPLLHKIDSTVRKLSERFDVENKIRIKKLVKTYHEAKIIDKSDHKYIINFDSYSTKQKREVLVMYLGAKSIKTLSDEKVERLFGNRISTIIKELESDIGSRS